MKRIKLTIDDQEFEFEVEENRLKKITDVLFVSKNGYEHAMRGFYVSARDEVFEIPNTGDSGDTLYEVGNYYNDRQLAESCARADRLMRLLRRFSAEHRTKDLSNCSYTWAIQYFPKTGEIIPCDIVSKYAGAVLFDTKEACKEAIARYYNQLKWYFTTFQDTTQKLYI